jgi:hypothetical protein
MTKIFNSATSNRIDPAGVLLFERITLKIIILDFLALK